MESNKSFFCGVLRGIICKMGPCFWGGIKEWSKYLGKPWGISRNFLFFSFILWVGNNWWPTHPVFFLKKDETLLGDPKREIIFVLGSTSWNSRKTPGHSCCHSLCLLYSFAVVRNLSWAWERSFCICPQTRPGVCNNIQLWDMCKKKWRRRRLRSPCVLLYSIYCLENGTKNITLLYIKKNILMLTFFS